MADIITRLLTLVEQHGPTEAERIVRSQDGGCRHYVAARMPVDHAKNLGELLQQGLPLKDVYRLSGVSPRHGRRILGQKNRPNRG
jgi:hypothetical protein